MNPETEVLIYHKPTGQVCSNVPTDKNDSVFQGLPARKKGKWIMVGRLDVNTSGLLIFSNDGNLVNFLAHPSSNIVGNIYVEFMEMCQIKKLKIYSKE